MNIRSKHLCRHVLENQHKMFKHLQQHLRLCSTGNVKFAHKMIAEETDPVHILAATSSGLSPLPFEHSPDIGQHFLASDLGTRFASPAQLQPKPDADDLSFGKNFTDHMLKIVYHKSLGGWQKPEITPLENLVIHPAAKVLHYAVELFEGMKAYRGVDGRIRIFRPNMNMNRMNLTARRSGLPTFEGNELIKCLSRLVSIEQEWVPHTEAASLYIRPTLIGIEPTLGVSSSESALLYAILCPVGAYFSSGANAGVSLLADPRFTRAWPGGCGDRKMGSNYAPTIHVQEEAAKRGLQQVLWLYGEDHQLTEVGTMNVFMLYVNDNGEKELITPPLNGLILPGITRDSILTLARQERTLKVREATFTMPMVVDLIKSDRLLEIFGAGTACVVSPIDRINYMGDDYHIPTLEQENSYFGKTRDTLLDMQYGRVQHPWAVVID